MGARLSLLAPSAPTVAISSYIDVLGDWRYVDMVNNSRFLKTIRAIDIATGQLVVIKVFIKPSLTTSNYNINLGKISELTAKEASLLAGAHNVLPWHKIIETDRAGYLIRQFMKTNLYDRLSIRPFLEPIEKLFITFQLLRAVHYLHDTLHLHHGDIKLENVLVSSCNWIALSDFSGNIKPTFIPEDNPNQFSFYFDTNGRRVCYLAPERFYALSNHKKVSNINDEGEYCGKDMVTDAMDLFALGCLIAELYNDGEPTFTLSQMFQYLKNSYRPNFSGLSDPLVRKIVSNLVDKEPENRPLAYSILQDNRASGFPSYFYDFLYDFMARMNLNNHKDYKPNDNVTISDLKITEIYDNFEKITSSLAFNYDEKPYDYHPSNDMAPLRLSLPGVPQNYKIKPSSAIDTPDHGAIIILKLVFSLMRTLKQPESKLKACEIVVALSERVSDECKLDCSIPYLCSFIDEFIDRVNSTSSQRIEEAVPKSNIDNFAAKVVCKTLVSITTILQSCSAIPPIDLHMFPEYLLPKLSSLLSSSNSKLEHCLIRITLASCLPILASTSRKFWMMAKNFKSNSMKKTSQYFPAEAQMNNNLVFPKSQLDNDFEALALQLLTDSSAHVKIAFVRSIFPMCQFFGVAKSNDIILPHLITFLNDPSEDLRLAFLGSILEVGPFLGVITFHQYLLPLLVQTLGDSEQLVVIKVLEIFSKFVRARVVNPKADFNSLSIYKEMLTSSIILLLHPNEWIRQSVLSLVLAISDNLLYADRYTFLYPIIKEYLSFDLAEISWDTLYPCLVKPLSKQVFDLIITWSLNATAKSLFWQQRTFSQLTGAYGNRISKTSIPFVKPSSKSVYVPKSGHDDPLAIRNSLPLSAEDKQWLLKLKATGLDERDSWKVLAVREYVYHVSRFNYSTSNRKQYDYSKVNITPHNVFFEVCYKTEQVAESNRMETRSDSFDMDMNGKKLKDLARRDSNSLILPNFKTVKASLETVQANVYGEIEVGGDSKSAGHHHHLHSTKETTSSHHVFNINKQKIITANVKHSYNGQNPNVLKFLNGVEITPTMNSFPEFGKVVKKSAETISDEDWNFGGLLLSHINSQSSLGSIDAIRCLEVSPRSDFFVTGSDSGLLRVWDTSKLEKEVSVRSSSLLTKIGSLITSIKLLPNRNVIAVSTIDGRVSIFRIEVVRGNKKAIRYHGLKQIRSYELDLTADGYVTQLEIGNGEGDLLIASTTMAKFIGFDVIKMEKQYELQSNLKYGAINTFLVGSDHSWLICGTSMGILSLWDLRFHIEVRTWRLDMDFDIDESSELGTRFPIKILLVLTDYGRDGEEYFAMVAGDQESDFSIWQVPKFECRQIYSSYVAYPQIKSYQLIPMDKPKKEIRIEQLVQDVMNFTTETVVRSMTALKHVKHGRSHYMITSTQGGEIVVWNLGDPTKSKAISTNSTFTSTKINSTMQIINEKRQDKVVGEHLSYHDDIVTGAVATREGLVITVDRMGRINAFK